MKSKFFIILVTLIIANLNFAFAALPGYTELNSKPGWSINKKVSSGNHEVYIQVIKLKNNKLIFIDKDLPGEVPFTSFSITDMWNSLQNTGIYSLSNGAFFEKKTNTSAGLSFPYKVDNVVQTMGWVTGNYQNQLKMLALNYNSSLKMHQAKVLSYDEQTFKSSTYPNVLVGLHPNYDKGVGDNKGRTFIGVNNNPYDPTVYILNAEFIDQVSATQELINLGVNYNDVIMFDGSGSTQLAYKNNQNKVNFIYGCENVFHYCKPEVVKRNIPQAIAVMPR